MNSAEKSGRQWFVVSTKVRRERFAQDQLQRRGVANFMPQLVEAGRPQPVPLFPGYLFIHIEMESQFSDVVWTPGVRRLVSFGDAPAIVDDGAIRLMQERLGPSGILVAESRWRAGDVVRIRRGPLEGLVGVLENPGCGRGRVRVLLELLRRQTRVELPDHVLERVSA